VRKRFLLPLLSPLLCLALSASDANAQDLPEPEAPEEEAANTATDDEPPPSEEGEPQQDEDLLSGEESAGEDAFIEDALEEPLEPAPVAAPLDFWKVLPLEFDLVGKNKRDRLDEPGAAERLGQPLLERAAPTNVSEALGLATGIFTAESSEMGLRPDIGVRGLPPQGSRHVLVLEDGVPISAAPYTDGSLYYMTPIQRVDTIEILKSSGTVLYGPRNLGGAINIITTKPPRAFTPSGFIEGGSYGRLNLGASVGDVRGAVSYWLGINHRRYESPRELGMEATDIAARFNLQVSERAWFGAKLSLYDEFSRDSDVGLTRDLYQADPTLVLNPYDRQDMRRFAASINHSYLLGDYGLWQTTLWAHHTSREHQQQRYDRQDLTGTTTNAYERIVTADPGGVAASDGSALFFQDATRVDEQIFDVLGVSSRLTLDFSLGKAGRSEVLLGLQAMREDTSSERRAGEYSASPSGSLERDEELTGRSLATYMAGRAFFIDERLRLFAGARFEFLQTELRTWRAPDVDATARDLDPPGDESANITGVLPGAGVSFDAADWLTLFVGSHRGMATPVAQYAAEETFAIDPEFAWNQEIGARAHPTRWLEVDATGFWIETQNLILTQPQTNDGVDTERGATRHLGVELSGGANFAAPFRTNWRLPVRATYTYLRATLEDGPQASIGNLVPYAPANQWGALVGLEHPVGFAAQATGRVVGRRYTDIAGTVDGNPDGIRGLTDDYFLLDARVAYTYRPWDATFYILGKNLTDTTYISTRAPSGIQARGEREFIGGVSVDF
jgi:Fe(3+) dicitrate transport protein